MSKYIRQKVMYYYMEINNKQTGIENQKKIKDFSPNVFRPTLILSSQVPISCFIILGFAIQWWIRQGRVHRGHAAKQGTSQKKTLRKHTQRIIVVNSNQKERMDLNQYFKLYVCLSMFFYMYSFFHWYVTLQHLIMLIAPDALSAC